MDSRTARILVSAVLLLAFAIYNFATFTSTSSHQSTFTLQPGLSYEIPATLNPSDTASGSFQENSGLPVNFFILSSAQFAAYEANGRFTYLYSVPNVSSGTYSYTATFQDTYYLFFDHGSGLGNSAETVFAVRDYTTHISSRLYFGIFFVAAAAADFYFAYRSNRRRVSITPTTPPTASPPVASPS